MHKSVPTGENFHKCAKFIAIASADQFVCGHDRNDGIKPFQIKKLFKRSAAMADENVTSFSEKSLGLRNELGRAQIAAAFYGGANLTGKRVDEMLDWKE